MATTNLLPVAMDLPPLHARYKWKHKLCGLLCLASVSFPGSVLLFMKGETVAQTDTVIIQTHLATKSQVLYSALLRASAWGLWCGELQVMENLTPHLIGSIIQQ